MKKILIFTLLTSLALLGEQSNINPTLFLNAESIKRINDEQSNAVANKNSATAGTKENQGTTTINQPQTAASELNQKEASKAGPLLIMALIFGACAILSFIAKLLTAIMDTGAGQAGCGCLMAIVVAIGAAIYMFFERAVQ